MNPVTKAKSRRKKGDAFEIERSDKKKVPVKVVGQRITAQWDCQTRSFDVEDLRLFIEHVDLMAKIKEPMSLTWSDTDGRTFWCRLKDGRLHAGEQMTGDERVEHVLNVSWALLKRAFQSAITECLSS